MLILLATLMQQPARDPHAVQPERPTVATHAHTVAPGWLELEFGGEYDHYSAATGRTHGVFTPLTAKIGLTSHAQLTVQSGLVAPPGESLSAADLSVGLKWRLADHAPVLGDFSILPSIKFATGSVASGAGTGTTDVGLLLVSSHAFGPVSLDLNAGYTRRSGDGSSTPRDATVWAASFSGMFVDAVGWVAELSGRPPTSGPAGQDNIVAVLAGPTFSLASWATADLGGSLVLTGPQPDALFAGLTVNIGRIWSAGS